MFDQDEIAEIARRRVATVLDRCALEVTEVDCPQAVGLAIHVGDEICMASCLRGTGNRCLFTVGVSQDVSADERSLLRSCNDHNVTDLTARALLRPSFAGYEVLVQETLPVTLLEESPAFAGWLVRTMVGETRPALRRRLDAAGFDGRPYVWGVADDIDRLAWMSVS